MRDLAVKPYYGVIKEYEHWVVLFREKQVTIGSLIIMSKHADKQSMGALSSEAWAEFGAVCHDVERALGKAFGAEKYNYLGLMMVDPEVHFHVIPRYSEVVFFGGQEFVDVDWPAATHRVALHLDSTIKSAIEQHVYQAMNH